MKLYHIHKSNDKDELYKKNKTFTVGNDFNYFTYMAFLSTPSELYNPFMQSYIDFNEILKPENLSKFSVENQLLIFKDLRVYIHNQLINTREFVLEQARLNIDSSLPSRQRCIWLTDEKCLEYWMNKIKGYDLSVYSVDIKDDPFVSSDKLLPDPKTPIIDMLEAANKYWRPNEEELENDNTKEYLYEGEVKILGRVL